MRHAADNIFIRFFEPEDAEFLLDIHLRNREFFQKYSPALGDDYNTLEAKREFIRKSAKERAEDKKYSFGIFLKPSGKLVGEISLYHIFRGSLQKGMIGYSLDQEYGGRGYATEAAHLAVEYAFTELKLHRIEAGVMLSNPGSMRVLEKAGFHREGIEQKGVKINGRWEDHQIYALVAEN